MQFPPNAVRVDTLPAYRPTHRRGVSGSSPTKLHFFELEPPPPLNTTGSTRANLGHLKRSRPQPSRIAHKKGVSTQSRPEKSHTRSRKRRTWWATLSPSGWQSAGPVCSCDCDVYFTQSAVTRSPAWLARGGSAVTGEHADPHHAHHRSPATTRKEPVSARRQANECAVQFRADARCKFLRACVRLLQFLPARSGNAHVAEPHCALITTNLHQQLASKLRTLLCCLKSSQQVASSGTASASQLAGGRAGGRRGAHAPN